MVFLVPVFAFELVVPVFFFVPVVFVAFLGFFVSP